MGDKKKIIIISSTVVALLVVLLLIVTVVFKQKNNDLQTNKDNISESEEKSSKISLKAKASGKTLKFTVSLNNINNEGFDIEKSYNEQFEDSKELDGSHNNEQYEDDLTDDIENNVEKCFYRLKVKNNNEIIYSNVLKITLKNQFSDTEIIDENESIKSDEFIDIENSELNIAIDEKYIAENGFEYTNENGIIDENEPFYDEMINYIDEYEKNEQEPIEFNNEVKYVSLSETVINLDISGYNTTTLLATITPSNAIDTTIEWKSSNPQIASVDQNGKITARSNGTAIITAKTSNEQSQTCEVNVTTSPSKVTLNNSSVSLDMLNSREVCLQATIEPLTSIDKNLIWTSSNENVATVDSNGNVIANSNGTAIIKCETPNGKSASCNINVITSGSGIYLNKSSVNLNLDDTKQINLKATIIPSSASNKVITWSSSDPSIATVDTNGLVTAKKSGNATITANTSNGRCATCKVVVSNLVTKINLDKTILSIDPTKSNKAKLNATVYPANATNKKVKWISSDSSIATVDSNGNVVAKKVGKVTITASCGDVKSKCTVNVMYKKGLYKKYDADSKLRYWIYIPDISALKELPKIPLIIYLHGDNVPGTDLDKFRKDCSFMQVLSEDISYNKYGAIIIAPQSENVWWNTPGSSKALIKLINNIVVEYGISKDKISITGNSGGGVKAWAFAHDYSDLFSCVALIGTPRRYINTTTNIHKKLSLWCITGENEGIYRHCMEDLYNLYVKNGGTAKLTVIPGMSHNSYIPYHDYDVFNWMASQTKK